MERAPLSVGQRLEQERLNRGWTQEQVAEHIGVDLATYRRWERDRHKPQRLLLQKLCMLFGKTAQDLGLIRQDETGRPTGGQTLLVGPNNIVVRDAATLFRIHDLTAHLQALIWSWLLQNTNARYHELQAILILELERRDNSEMNDDVLSRRDALRRLARLPIDYCGLSLFAPALLRPVEEILALCASGITACWQLRKGKDLSFAFDTVSWYLPTLKAIATTGSTLQRKEASELLAQSLTLQSILSWHVSNQSDGTLEAQQASDYAKAAESPLLQMMALRTQSVAHRFSNRWDLALQVGEQAKYLLQTANLPLAPRLRSYIYGGLAVCQAYKGQKQDALRSLKISHETFYLQSTDAPMPIPVEMYHDEPNLVINDGLTHLYLGLYPEAFDSFAQVATLNGKTEIHRIEALIHQVKAEVSREDKEPDMDLSIALWTQGIEGAKALGSQQRFNEAIIAYAAMSGLWRKEQAVKDLRSLIVWPEKKSRND